jgi:hypothetical protein
MKGVVFTEFLEMVEDKFGFDVVENVIEQSESDLPSKGIYTAVGTYSHKEIITLVVNLSKEISVDVPVLVHAFGKHLLGQFAKSHGSFFDEVNNTFDLLKSIDGHIHVEVKKLYPDAELPRFESYHPNDDENKLEMIYISERSMSDLAAGLIEGCIEYYNEPITYTKENLDDNSGTKVLFKLEKK